MNNINEYIFDTSKEIRSFFTSSKRHLMWGLTVANENSFYAIVETKERTIHIIVWMDTKNGYVVFEAYPGIRCAQPYRRQTLDFGTIAISKEEVGLFRLKDNGTVYVTNKIPFHDAPATCRQLFQVETDLLRFISKYAEDIDYIAHGCINEAMLHFPEETIAALSTSDPLGPGEDDEGYFDNALKFLIDELDKKASEYIDEMDSENENPEKEAAIRSDLLDLFCKALEHIDDDKKEE